jgi:hypothetical protein
MSQYKFLVQVFFSLGISSFCIFQLSASDVKDKAMYWGALTGVSSYWLPSPTEEKSD